MHRGFLLAFGLLIALGLATPTTAAASDGPAVAVQPAAGCRIDVAPLFAAETPASISTADAAVSAAPVEPIFLAKRGYCHCSCSATPNCRTSADCGGSSCDAFISCC